MSKYVCFRCHRHPDEIPEYVAAAAAAEDEEMTPDEWVRREEGTLNRHGRFACTECYMAIGAPSAPWPGWQAP